MSPSNSITPIGTPEWYGSITTDYDWTYNGLDLNLNYVSLEATSSNNAYQWNVAMNNTGTVFHDTYNIQVEFGNAGTTNMIVPYSYEDPLKYVQFSGDVYYTGACSTPSSQILVTLNLGSTYAITCDVSYSL